VNKKVKGDKGLTDEPPPRIFHFLIVAGGQAPSPRLLKNLTKLCRQVVTVDRGAEALYKAGLKPDLHVGDNDSLSPKTLARLGRTLPAKNLIKLPRRKSVSDLEFALSCLPKKTLKIVTGAHRDTEGRMDHVFVNFLVALRNPQVYLVDEKMWIKGLDDGKFTFSAPKKTAFSLVCLEKQRVTISGSDYDVKDRFFSSPSFGLSNRVKTSRVEIVTRGPALLFVASNILSSLPLSL
jgi:thiamine pyrophosphokinase